MHTYVHIGHSVYMYAHMYYDEYYYDTQDVRIFTCMYVCLSIFMHIHLYFTFMCV